MSEHRINRDRPVDTDDWIECEECGREFPSEERLHEHRDRVKRETLRGSELGDVILEVDKSYRDYK